MRVKRTVIATAGIAMLALATSCSFFKDEEEPVIPTSCPNPVIGEGTLTCGGQTYRTLLIGEQTWMADNINYAADSIGNRCYGDDPANCNTYGRLYNWATAKSVCPKGWHLPSQEEWETLRYIGYDGSPFDEGEYFKAASILSGRGNADGSFSELGELGIWWSATEWDSGNVGYIRILNEGYNGNMVYLGGDDKSNFFSVRCLKD